MAGSHRAVLLGASMAAVIVGQMVAGKATRDALFLTHFDISQLPRIMLVAAVLSAVVTLGTTRLRVRTDPRRLTGALALITGVLLVGYSVLAPRAPRAVAAVFFLHTMIMGPLLATAFWSVVNESLDPRSAKAAIGKISAGGTLGAAVAGLLAERIASFFSVEAVFLLLLGSNVVCLLALPLFPKSTAPRATTAPPKASISAVMEGPYLRTIAVLVVLTVLGAALLDFAFKAEAVEAFGEGDTLLRFFSFYYVGASLLAFAIQVGVGTTVVEKLGVVRTVSSLPLTAMVAGGLAAVFGGVIAATAAYGLERIVRSSVYRTGYELLYMPVAPHRKRAGKPFIEIVVDRGAEAVAAGLIALVLWAVPGLAVKVCFAGAAVFGLLGFALVRRLQPGYVAQLERQLEDVPTLPAAAALLHEGTLTIDGRGALTAYLQRTDRPTGPAQDLRVVQRLSGLLSSDSARVLLTLEEARPLDGRLVSAVLPLLDDRVVKREAFEALREVGERHLGQLADVLANPAGTPYRVRARVAHLLGELPHPRAVDALVLGLSDPRFTVRQACGHGLRTLREAMGDFERPERFFQAVIAAIAQLGDAPESTTGAEPEGEEDTFAELLRDRSQRELAHVFRLLALVLPPGSSEQAFKGVLSDESHARGTALEYLENVVPSQVWAALAPVLEG